MDGATGWLLRFYFRSLKASDTKKGPGRGEVYRLWVDLPWPPVSRAATFRIMKTRAQRSPSQQSGWRSQRDLLGSQARAGWEHQGWLAPPLPKMDSILHRVLQGKSASLLATGLTTSCPDRACTCRKHLSGLRIIDQPYPRLLVSGLPPHWIMFHFWASGLEVILFLGFLNFKS